MPLPLPTLYTEYREARRQAEQFLLGAILIESAYHNDRQVITEVSTIVLPNDFSDFTMFKGIHTRIYKAMLATNQAPHQINVAEYLYKQDELEKRDCRYLRILVANCECSLDYLDYAKTVHNYAQEHTKSIPVRGGIKL